MGYDLSQKITILQMPGMKFRSIPNQE